jgi:DivIVA domain-containing protein
MADPLEPASVERRTFRRVLRGYDTDEVDAFLKEVAILLRNTKSQYDVIHNRLLELGNKDMSAEFDLVSEDVGRILHEARQTAEGMRRRAAADAEVITEEAQAASVELRTDAWMAAEKLLQDATKEASSIVQAGERESLAVISEAEREAHRRQSAARRESDETIRAAKLEAERVLMDARARSDELMVEANRNVEAAQVRAAAVDERRTEMLEELVNARETIGNLEQEIEKRREALAGPSPEEVESSTVKLLSTSEQEQTEEDKPVWSEGHEVVRIVRPPKRIVDPPPEPVDADAMAAEVARLRAPLVEIEPEPAPVEEPTEVEEIGEQQAPAVVPEAEAPSPPRTEIDDLFARLRSIEESPPATRTPPPEVIEEQPEELPSAEPERPARPGRLPDPFDVRDGLLLPVTNRVLRSVKRELTEAQNIALEELRLEEGSWDPIAAPLEERLREPVEGLLAESYAAGLHSAGGLTGVEVQGESDRQGDAISVAAGFSQGLTEAVAESLTEARRDGQGPRQLAAGLSRIYRFWRTDEAERRVRDIASGAYHRGLLDGFGSAEIGAARWLVAGRGCAVCREAAEAGVVAIGDPFEGQVTEPPAHPDCGCTLVPADLPNE